MKKLVKKLVWKIVVQMISVVLEINGTGCNLDIPKTFDRFEPKNQI